MKTLLILLLTLSCTTARIRRLNPDGFVKAQNREYDVYHSKKELANLEIYFSEGIGKDMNNATLRAVIVNGTDDELKINLKDSYQWSAWYRWQRRPREVSDPHPISLKAFEKKEVSWEWMRREYGVLIVPFTVDGVHDEFQIKFENCGPWEDCKTDFTK